MLDLDSGASFQRGLEEEQFGTHWFRKSVGFSPGEDTPSSVSPKWGSESQRYSAEDHRSQGKKRREGWMELGGTCAFKREAEAPPDSRQENQGEMGSWNPTKASDSRIQNGQPCLMLPGGKREIKMQKHPLHQEQRGMSPGWNTSFFPRPGVRGKAEDVCTGKFVHGVVRRV